MRRWVAFTSVLFVLAACTGGGEDEGTPSPTSAVQPSAGGVLRVGLVDDAENTWDPQVDLSIVSDTVFPCCLLRTLYAYDPSVPPEVGEAPVVLDLAAEEPVISDDQLTWTFTIRDGARFAPPVGTEITAQDFIRAFEREFTPEVASAQSFDFENIVGTKEFYDGEADTIAGLSAPDDKTLVIELSKPTPLLPYLLARSAAAPIPPNPENPEAGLGVAEGHDNYGRFLVASGPYMFEGSETLDFSLPPEEQSPVSGYTPDESIALVRNPNWDPASDPVRGNFAFPDRMEFTIGSTPEDYANKVRLGEIDFQLDGNVPPSLVQEYLSNPDLESRVHIAQNLVGSRYITLTMASPPLDDVHVRKAINYAIDKESLLRLLGGETFGRVLTHIIPDSALENQLADYDPYPYDPDAAKEEMALSGYDSNGDGVCDDPVCKGVVALVTKQPPYPDTALRIQENLTVIGVDLQIRELTEAALYGELDDPKNRIPMALTATWQLEVPDGSSYGFPLFGSESIGPAACCNEVTMGASPELLSDFGFPVTEVPSVDDRIAACEALPIGEERLNCWIDYDRYLMEDIAPWVPYQANNQVRVVSERVLTFEYYTGIGGPQIALDRIALVE